VILQLLFTYAPPLGELLESEAIAPGTWRGFCSGASCFFVVMETEIPGFSDHAWPAKGGWLGRTGDLKLDVHGWSHQASSAGPVPQGRVRTFGYGVVARASIALLSAGQTAHLQEVRAPNPRRRVTMWVVQFRKTNGRKKAADRRFFRTQRPILDNIRGCAWLAKAHPS